MNYYYYLSSALTFQFIQEFEIIVFLDSIHKCSEGIYFQYVVNIRAIFMNISLFAVKLFEYNFSPKIHSSVAYKS